jgi:cation diffusion facilitator family transporter
MVDALSRSPIDHAASLYNAFCSVRERTMAEDSKLVVYAALGGNVLVAASKFTAAALSGSSAMLTEAVHSSADCANQLLLLFGTYRSRKRSDKSHPFGYDGEVYFWAFVVAVMVLLAGGATSIYQGIRQIRDPHAIESLSLSLIVLSLSAVFEAVSLIFGYRASRRMVERHPGDGKPVSLWRFIKLSKDPNMYESLLEDSAALIGIALATIGVLGSVFLNLLWMDGAASIAIGVLLIANSYVIAYATRSLIAGESVAPAVRMEIDESLNEAGYAGQCSHVKSLHLGPKTILITLSVDQARRPVGSTLVAHLDDITRCIKRVDERIRHVFFTIH